MDSQMFHSETFAINQKLKQIKGLVGTLEQDVHTVLEANAKEFIHIFSELSQLLHQVNEIHSQMVPRAEYMLEHKNETIRKLRKETFWLVK
jgi:hypothetical protein